MSLCVCTFVCVIHMCVCIVIQMEQLLIKNINFSNKTYTSVLCLINSSTTTTIAKTCQQEAGYDRWAGIFRKLCVNVNHVYRDHRNVHSRTSKLT